ncbi:hypothetical protein WBG78_28995 [Chryseolinea sp. T2]|uniref:tetratricopeptide repeat protein n=1 Tax=Chryseolinea sp. T2 TaxID=3129255 RepID=UPI003078470A
MARLKYNKKRLLQILMAGRGEVKLEDNALREMVRCYESCACWDGIIDGLEFLLEDDPHDHWILVQVAHAYYEKECNEKALKYITAAMRVQYECAAAQWLLAAILRMRGQHADALEIWETLITNGASQMAQGKCICCREYYSWGTRKIADAKYMLSLTNSDLGYMSQARYWRDAYRLDLEEGAESMMDGSFLDREIERNGG